MDNTIGVPNPRYSEQNSLGNGPFPSSWTEEWIATGDMVSVPDVPNGSSTQNMNKWNTPNPKEHKTRTLTPFLHRHKRACPARKKPRRQAPIRTESPYDSDPIIVRAPVISIGNIASRCRGGPRNWKPSEQPHGAKRAFGKEILGGGGGELGARTCGNESAAGLCSRNRPRVTGICSAPPPRDADDDEDSGPVGLDGGKPPPSAGTLTGRRKTRMRIRTQILMMMVVVMKTREAKGTLRRRLNPGLT